MSEMNEGIVNAIAPQNSPKNSAARVPCEIRNDSPMPTVGNKSEAIRIVLVEGNATCLIML